MVGEAEKRLEVAPGLGVISEREGRERPGLTGFMC